MLKTARKVSLSGIFCKSQNFKSVVLLKSQLKFKSVLKVRKLLNFLLILLFRKHKKTAVICLKLMTIFMRKNKLKSPLKKKTL